MLELEIDGKALQVADGSTVIEAAHSAGIYIPHFCYHKKLSIAANCRMCLVEVEKAPKPMPACATAVSNGMKVFTHSQLAAKAQKDVMEFLLINHPLDCPICDQGGECQLQDLAVGYGSSGARYQEPKRVVINKYLGPLVGTDMTRCINCTRCVRFTQEIAGHMELGQAFRGDRAEIMPYVEKTVDSELSGNIIDLCPVGALTSKPFRFAARSWELSRRRSVSPHDGLGSNLIVQTKHDRVYRVLPLENEAINECWLSDKDRYAYEGLNSEERLTRPMLKQGGEWREVAWQDALDYAAHALRDISEKQGADEIGALLSPHATLEELALAARLMRGLGSDNLDFRLRQQDFSLDGQYQGIPWLGMQIGEIASLDRVLVIGSFLRNDHPLLALRLRQAAKRGTQLSLLHSSDDDLLVKYRAKSIVAPSLLPQGLAEVVKAVAKAKNATLDADLKSALAKIKIGEAAEQIAASLVSGEQVGILLGNFAEQHPAAASLHRLAQQLASLLAGRFGFLGTAANSVGGHLAQALPRQDGRNAARLLSEPRRAYLLLGTEAELDCADGAAALAALAAADSVIMLSAFKSAAALEYADCLLPISPFSETSGTFVNTEGRIQSFQAVTRPLAEARPAWKVLRVLGNLLQLDGFEQSSSEEVRDSVLHGAAEFVNGLDNTLKTNGALVLPAAAGKGVERISDVPIYAADPLVRRATALQQTKAAAAPVAALNATMLAQLKLEDGGQLRVTAGKAAIELVARLDASVPDACVRIATAHANSVALGAISGTVSLERV